MSVERFTLDTNILVYAVDSTADAKQELCAEIEAEAGRFSWWDSAPGDRRQCRMHGRRQRGHGRRQPRHAFNGDQLSPVVAALRG
jgi:hypothetical protein